MAARADGGPVGSRIPHRHASGPRDADAPPRRGREEGAPPSAGPARPRGLGAAVRRDGPARRSLAGTASGGPPPRPHDAAGQDDPAPASPPGRGGRLGASSRPAAAAAYRRGLGENSSAGVFRVMRPGPARGFAVCAAPRRRWLDSDQTARRVCSG